MQYRLMALCMAGLLACMWSRAAVIEVNFSASVSSGEYTCDGGCPAVENEILQYQLSTQDFSVGAGDTVMARLSFNAGETFRLLFDPLSPAVGAQGFLLIDPSLGSYQTSVGFTFAFLDTIGQTIKYGFDGKNGNTSGDVRGNVTIAQANDWDVGGLLMEFSNFTDPIGSLPLTFNGVRFRITNGKFGEPFSTGPTSGQVPEPATLVLVGAALFGVAASRRRRPAVTTA